MSKWKDNREAEQQTARAEQDQQPMGMEELEAAFASDIDELHRAFRERTSKENKRFKDVYDTDYYFTVCFSNQEQMVEFCESVGLNSDQIYIDGREFARKIGKALKTADTEFPKTQPFNRDYVARAREK